MSDSDFGAVSLYLGLLDITDEAWTTANLSDDEIDLPDGHDVVVDDGEVDLGESIEAAEQEDLKWTDKGIDLLLQREGGAPTASN
ncbi:unnamed protein product [Pylaiella littoralis]